MNAKIKKTLVDQAGYWPNVEFGDFSNQLDKIEFYRWDQTRFGHEPDPVHFSDLGTQRFQEILNTQITRLKGKNSACPKTHLIGLLEMRSSPNYNFNEKDLKTEAHWMYWRKETYGLRTPKRFKITNYAPAIEGRY